jgi:hypothetical protein
MEHIRSARVAERRHACGHMKTMKQYRKSNIIIETRGKENQLQDKQG